MESKKLVWAIDLDDVVVPTGPAIVEAYNRSYGTSLGLEALYNDDQEVWGVSRDEAIKRRHDLFRSGVTTDIAPFPEAVDALFRLASTDELHVVTGRQSFLEPATRTMINRYLPGVFRSIVHTNYHFEQGSGVVPRTKGEVCAEIGGVDFLVDDHVAHGQSVLEYGIEAVIVWGDYPWNRYQELGKGMVRCVVWEEVFDVRERILANRK